MANTTYVVVSGDTLSTIAAAHNTTVAKLVELNKIPDPDYIVVGQKLIISGTAKKVSKNTSSKPKIRIFGLQSGTTSTMYAAWTWDKSNTEHYQVKWLYDTGDGVWFIGSETTVTAKQCTYTAPDNAKAVKFTVRPVSKKRTVKKKETSYWTASWSTTKLYDFINNPPTTPPVPTVTIEDFRLTAKLENLDVNAVSIQFKVVQNDVTVFKISNTTIRTETNSAQYACIVSAGNSYKVACRSVRGTLYSDWSEFSSAVNTIPVAPTNFLVCKANSENSVYLEWMPVNTADSYDIQYTTKLEYFDSSNATTEVNDIETTKYVITGLETGTEYFFRLRATNEEGESGWSPAIARIILGDEPAPPTTWSSTTTAVVGETLNLYWIHNAKDESSQTYAELELIIDGIGEVHTIKNSDDEEEKDKTSVYSIDTNEFVEGSKILWRVRTAGVTKVYGDWSIQRTVDIYAQPTLAINLADSEGNALTSIESFPFYISALASPKTQAPIGYYLTITSNEMYETVDDIGNAKVVTKGEAVYSKYFDISSALLVEFSANNIDLENNMSYTATCSVTMNSGLTAESTVDFSVAWADMEYEPNAEIGIDYSNLSAIIRPYCEDEYGNIVRAGKNLCPVNNMIVANTTIWSCDYVDIPNIDPGTYTIQAAYSQKATQTSISVSVRRLDDILVIIGSTTCTDLEGIATYSFVIPEDVSGIRIYFYSNLTSNAISSECHFTDIQVEYGSEATEFEPYVNQEVYLSVYRREFDGSFTEIIKNVENTNSLFVTDPHPALDYARYRIVATSKTTGSISYTDLAGYPIGETSIVLQWSEDWSTFDTTNEDEMEEPTWSGSLLKLPYNVDVADNHNSDVAMVEYIGRKRPVTYYGTQLGHTATWNVDIVKDDKETLYALRRLAMWMGDVYVREPSGSGYWANVSVSFSQKHKELTIPVSLNITRVEGGV